MQQKIMEFLSPPIFDDDGKTRIASHVFLLSKISLGVFPILFISYLFFVKNSAVTIFVFWGLILVVILPMLLTKIGYVRLAGTFFTLILWLLINYSTLTTGGIRAVGFGGNLIILLAAAMLIDLRAVFIFGIASSALGLLLAYLQTKGILPPVPERVSAYTSWMIQTVFLVLNAGLLYIVIDNLQRAFNQMRHAEKEVRTLNQELTSAYDTTLDGWAKALELRDKETEGHSRRVTALAKLLAVKLGVSKEDLIHLYYGSLLHDIGKMGIPDEILHKPDKLTDEERKIVETHPTIAFNLLKNISYLQQAITVPHYHHEKWNGEGYPNGLKGENIPLLARIFSVIDVWDALISDRPYRKAWSKEKVINYMKEQSGKHFDPRILEVFLTDVIADPSDQSDEQNEN